MYNKLLSLVLAALLCAALFVPAFAGGTVNPAFCLYNRVNFAQTGGLYDGIWTLAISCTGFDDGVNSGTIEITYNPDVLEYIEPGGVTAEADITFSAAVTSPGVLKVDFSVLGSFETYDNISLVFKTLAKGELGIEAQLKDLSCKDGFTLGEASYEYDFFSDNSFLGEEIPVLGEPVAGLSERVNKYNCKLLKSVKVKQYMALCEDTSAVITDCDGRVLGADEYIPNGAVITSYFKGHTVDRLSFVYTGDVDMDGRVTTSDARLALRNAARLEVLREVQLRAMPLSGESTENARTILRMVAGLEV